MKKWMGTLAGAGLLLASWTPGALAATCGDVDNSGTLDGNDTVILVSRIFGGANVGDCGGLGTGQCGDLNGNGGFTIADLTILQNLVVGNPQIFNCSAPGTPECNVTLSGTISANRTLDGTPGCNNHNVNGTTFIANGAILTVQPGAIVHGVKGAATPSALVIRPGSKLNAAGTPANPIIFTSNQPDGSRGIGDWGGVVINGRAPVNCPGGTCLAEGLSNVEFGGNVPNDNSGILTYARVEFSGIELSADNELNILTMNGVGSGTIMNHIQTNHGFDDNFEWFGGTVNLDHLVASSIGDDALDWQLGFTGTVQFALVIENAANTDTNGRHGIEADNNENGFNFQPRSNPRLCNLTLIGTKDQGQAGNGRRGILFRRGTAGHVWNSIIDGFTQSGVQMDDNATAQQACINATTLKTTGDFLELKNAIIFGNTATTSGNASTPCTPAQWLTALGVTNNILTSDPQITEAPYPPTSGTAATADQYVPAAGSPAGGAPDCQALAPDIFVSAPYIGAFAPSATPASSNWLRDATGPWISFDTN